MNLIINRAGSYKGHFEKKDGILKHRTMKKIITIIAALALFSCKKDDIRCATCIEERTQYPLEYCGTKKQIEQYEQSLNLVGLSLGQKWECK